MDEERKGLRGKGRKEGGREGGQERGRGGGRGRREEWMKRGRD